MATVGVPLAMAAVEAGAGAAISAAMAPGTPQPKRPPLMPDQTTVLQQQQLKEARAAAMRAGRASTLLTSNVSTGDKLGP